MADVVISENEIKDVLDISNVHIASGRDLISYKMLEAVSFEVSKTLAIIMNRSLSEGRFPEVWKRSLVTPLYNKSTASGAIYARSSVIFSHLMAFVRGMLMQ